MTTALRERLHAIYAAFRMGSADFVLNACHEDIEYISYTPTKVFPALGHRRGKSGMADLLQTVHDQFEITSYEPTIMVVEADSAAVMIFARFINRKSGRSVQVSICHFLRFRDGRIVELRAFMDSFSAAEQLSGTTIAVPAT